MEDQKSSNINENDMSVIDLNCSVFINNKDSPKSLKDKCRELVMLPNEPKYRNYIDNIFKKSDNLYIDNHRNDNFFCQKYQELNEFVQSLKLVPKITIENFNKIKKYAISKGGFLSSENRKILYKKIYLLNHSNTYKMLYIDYKAIIDKNWDFHGLDIFSEKKIYDDIESTCDDRTIKADCPRSKILQMANNKNENEKDKENARLITMDLEKYLKLMCCLNKNIYNYFQGYHDLGLYFLLLYHKYPHYAVSVFQRFSEFNLKELLNIKYKQKKIEDDGKYNMIDMSDTLKILKFIIDFMAPEVKYFFEKKEQGELLKFNKNKIKEDDNLDKYSICDFAFEWIITLFTRYFENINNVYRIFDYLMVSHSLAIYFLCAEIIIDYYNKLKDKDTINDKVGQYDYFKNIKFDEVDFDYYIEKCENNLNKYIGNTKFKQMYKNLQLNKFYPIISEQAFVEKWVMCNNQEEYRGSFMNYLEGQWKLFKSIFWNDENKNNKKNENKENNKNNK